MKRQYVKPEALVVLVEPLNMICTSTVGVTGTGNLRTTVYNDETDEYLSRRSHSIWDDEE